MITVGGHVANTFYHDLAGWLMIPLALVLYWLEIWVLSRISDRDRARASPGARSGGFASSRRTRPPTVTAGRSPSVR